ncbi:DegT/DnrJ/EryC1/StrS family aminotransferase [Klenkia brasiliensis]|uniref:dTDP-4-amino-4,6-dideoxygalactose transaminase n=1 Tax=Klenkia brasiliensis TaxID=333142 RepID=A0A1G7LIB9_9ACTN|nr:DegT/DnrJ/EryC1/StrS family aminotransferase [Klenkia brasiliensis]SDF48740.1 dTDP-4-amino-4,6-dideoxygalactose transaminase [Klenkia brasiliensis]
MTGSRPQALAEPLYVSRPVLPPLADYVADLEEIWASGILTNMGAFHERLQAAVQRRVGVGEVTLWNNGTTALVAALAALDLRGEVVVTPFTFPATVQAIAALGLTPVFADVDPRTGTLSPRAVAERITAATSAIVGTHVYGAFCDTEALGQLAHEHGLKVVYDGAHSFARRTPVFPAGPRSLGDVTMLSFHATKLFHAVEGGALVTDDPGLHERLTHYRNFGIRSEDVVAGTGLNGKMSELHAAMGLRVLDMVDDEIDRRSALARRYVRGLEDVPGVSVIAGDGASVQYLVVRVDARSAGIDRDGLHRELRGLNIISRRYFHPLCSDIEPFSGHPSAEHLPVARRFSAECLALPLHGSMDSEVVDRICAAIAWHAAPAVRGAA